MHIIHSIIVMYSVMINLYATRVLKLYLHVHVAQTTITLKILIME